MSEINVKKESGEKIEGKRMLFRYNVLTFPTIMGSVDPLGVIIDNSNNLHNLEVSDLPVDSLVKVQMPVGPTYFKPCTGQELEFAKKAYTKSYEGDINEVAFVSIYPPSKNPESSGLPIISPTPLDRQR